MKLQVGDVWYGKQGTAFEGIQATIDDVTARYVQAAFTPPLYQKGALLYGKPLGKRQFTRNFVVQKQMTIFDGLKGIKDSDQIKMFLYRFSDIYWC